MIDSLARLIYSATRPFVMVSGWLALIFVAGSIVTGAATIEEANAAAAIIGPPTGIMTAWWFKSRDEEKARRI